MKNILTTIVFATFLSFSSIAQSDLSVTLMNAPLSGCALTASEVVSIRIFNYGTALLAGTSFPVSYTINAGVPVVETVTLTVNLLTNSTLNYSFLTTGNLSVPGSYTFDGTVSILGDINPSNNSFTGYVVVNTAASVGGTIAGPGSVCVTGNSGNLTLSGHTGSIVQWEFSTDGGIIWFNITNSTAVQNYLNLTTPRQYRALVQSGTCTPVYSSIVSITIDPGTVGGTVSTSSTVCIGGNSGTLSLTGKTGTVTRWEYSIDGGITYSPIINTTTTQTYLNLVVTTKYRALVQSGNCTPLFSTIATITVNPLTVGGTITPSPLSVCSGNNSGVLTLSGKVGNVTRWEVSTNSGLTWTNIANVTVTQAYLNIVLTSWYRALVQSSPCTAAYSSIAILTVTSSTVGGIITPATVSVCSGLNLDSLILTGSNGNVTQWEFSIDGGLTWTIIANITLVNHYSNLTQTTLYRALSQTSGCSSSYSNTATVTVDSPSLGGAIAGGSMLCSGANAGVLTLSGHSGSILNWETSPNGIVWTTLANTTTTQTYTNLISSTYYHAIVQNGVCTSDTSLMDSVIVDSTTVGGTIFPASTVICQGLNSGTLTLVGSVGNVVQWEYSTDGGISWISILNTTNSQSYSNLAAPTIYRALVQSGVCLPQYSAQSTFSINAQPIGGTLYSNATVCGVSNSSVLTLIGFSGSISFWESSADNGVTWVPIANNTNSLNFVNLVDTTIYRVIISSGVCFTDTSTSVTILVDAPSIGGMVTSDTVVCANSNSGVLSLSGETGSVVGWEYSMDGGITWINISNTTTSQAYLNVMVTSLYRARVSNGVCPPVASSIATITVDPMSVAGTIVGSTSICEGTGSGVLTLTGFTGSVLAWQVSTDAGLTWTSIANTGSTQTWNNPIDTSWYTAIVQSGACASDTSSPAVIIVYPKPVAGFTAPAVCYGFPTLFTDTTSIVTGGISFHNWDFGDNNASVAVNPLNTYGVPNTYNVVMIVISDHNCSDTITQSVLVNALPSSAITASPNLTICSGDSVKLNVDFASQLNYSWSTGATVDSIFASIAGNYSILVSDTISGCFSSDSATIIILQSPTANAGSDTSASAGYTISLLGSGGLLYQWAPSVGLSDPSSSNPYCTPPFTQTYTLTVTSFNGCTDTDAVVVTFLEDYNVIISNLITANDDGFNDVWNIQYIEFYPENKISIYNRNGMLVFKQDAYNNTWKGTFNGEQLPDGTYYYILEFTDSGATVKGALTIISEKK